MDHVDDNCFQNALYTVSREKCERGFWISSTDKKAFYDGLKVVESRKGEESVAHLGSRVYENKTDKPRVFPYTSHGYEHIKYEVNFAGNVQGRANLGVNRGEAGIVVQCDGFAAQRGEEGQLWERENLNLPPHTRMEESHNRYTTVWYNTYACQADLPIRVYSRKHVKNGATAAGTIGGAAGVAGGVAGGAAGGAVIGAAVGTVVPVVGNIVGCVFGGIIGGVAGGVLGIGVGGGGGAAIGAGVGAAVSNDNYVTVTAKEVFEKLPMFSEKEKMVYCEVSKSTVSEVVTATFTGLN